MEGDKTGRVETIFDDIVDELRRADAKYANDPMTTAELGLATIKCELAELEREVLRPVYNDEAMYKEAVQVASMAIKMMRDVIRVWH